MTPQSTGKNLRGTEVKRSYTKEFELKKDCMNFVMKVLLIAAYGCQCKCVEF